MAALSILIPTFNDSCLTMVDTLVTQCMSLQDGDYGVDSFDYEIIVADDASTDEKVMEKNATTAQMPGCKYIRRKDNVGRAAIRNFLARQASFDYLLFIDADMTIIKDRYIYNYVRARKSHCVVYGGYDVPRQDYMDLNLRYRYERACRNNHTVEKRQANPYLDFHTSNFMIPRALMLEHPFDENFRHYGYEDVAFGKELQEAGIKIQHIDNPVGFYKFEDNENFLRKTEEGIDTLVEFRGQLYNYSRLLQLAGKIKHWHLEPFCRTIASLFEKPLRKALVKGDISVDFLNLYKLSLLLERLKGK